MTIDEIIRKELDIEDKSLTKLCVDAESNAKNAVKVNSIVNNFIEPLETTHNIENEMFFKENGYLELGQLFSDDEVDQLTSLIENVPGYNYHIAANCYNREPKVF